MKYHITRENMPRDKRKALAFIERNGCVTISDVANHLGCRTYWAIEHLRFLERNGFVESPRLNEYQIKQQETKA